MEDRYKLFETIERLTGKTLVESELDEICRLFDDDDSLKKENKRLAWQVEVLSAAFANSSEKEKSLMEERDELLDFLENVAFPQRGSDAEKWNLSDVTTLATRLYKKHRFEPAE